MAYDHKNLEQKILKFWRQNNTFQKSIEQRKRSRNFVFYEGPPTANGKPGIHHVLTRVYKDLICRYKTLRGFRVIRKAGWDTHGLPVELEIERRLGFKTKHDIEKFGIEKFNALCKKSVWEYKKDWEKLTERIGFWLDMEHPYITYDPLYMESLFWIIKQLYKRELLYEGHKVMPWCPRCGTALSSHEVALGYKDITEESVYIKFKIRNPQSVIRKQLKAISNQQSAMSIYILAWTTTPWTLPGNVALAVGEKIRYVGVQQDKEIYILAKDRASILEGAYEIITEFSGKELEGVEYVPLFDSIGDTKEKKYYVATADFVSTEEGTGVVHTAVMYGEDDYQLGEKLGLPKIHTVREDGTFNERVPKWDGRFVKDVEKQIIGDLKNRNLLYKIEPYTHSYPFCWRCDTPLLYYARHSWFVAMSKLRKELKRNNNKINWIPHHLKEGRFGEWLREAKDWAFSRERYWGTPLPIWQCEDGHREIIGSRHDLLSQKFGTNTYFVMRHGYADSNHKRYTSCWPELPNATSHLTKKGVVQVKKAAQELKKKRIDVIIASDLFRTRETAEIIAKELGITPLYDAQIREVNVGVLNGRPINEYHVFFKSKEERFTKRPKNGETYNEVKKRMISFIEDINRTYHNKNILIVSHEAPLSMLEGAMRGFTNTELIAWRSSRKIDVGEVRILPFVPFPHNKEGELDFHNPFIDQVKFFCKICDGLMERVPDVSDVWFDSGAMPFAQAHYPFDRTDMTYRTDKIDFLFPADYICEAIDQTRGWFYTLLAVSTALGFGPPYLNVISTGHVLDEKGEKMSKSKGNVVDPWVVIHNFGSDAIRWYFFTINAPGDSKLFAMRDVEATLRRFLLTLWNVMEFYVMYVPAIYQKSTLRLRSGQEIKNQPFDFAQGKKSKIEKSTNVLDRWLMARFNQLTQEVTSMLDRYDVTDAARSIEKFVIEDLSQWYIRRSRPRFQKAHHLQEKEEASKTLYFLLYELSKLLAPFTPFVSESIYQQLMAHSIVQQPHESVHLDDWPKVDGKLIDKKLLMQMDAARHIVSLGLSARVRAGLKVRQPLAKLKIKNQKSKITNELLQLIKDELNVKDVEVVTSLPRGNEWVLEQDDDSAVAIHTTITPALQEEGLIREIIRNIQEMRKDAGYKPHHRIQVSMVLEKDMSRVLSRWKEFLKSETRIAHIRERIHPKEAFDREREVIVNGQKVWIGIRRI